MKNLTEMLYDCRPEFNSDIFTLIDSSKSSDVQTLLAGGFVSKWMNKFNYCADESVESVKIDGVIYNTQITAFNSTDFDSLSFKNLSGNDTLLFLPFYLNKKKTLLSIENNFENVLAVDLGYKKKVLDKLSTQYKDYLVYSNVKTSNGLKDLSKLF